ncbi:3D domain-containing protein [Paenibacillus sp. BK720]|uniref:3D domain-containing protein n=1 Tax=Paenibacillus sp. BK720 TaxID=2587092 RepID=UPI001FBA9F5B|nr:3D domain-containing protein [Paenibacillus sp. BK720]NIK67912.1 3D (Asp-Asp-Asp) domain-containing protein [Paenibacillus sp. BK720]
MGRFLITAYTAGYESTQKHKGEPGYGITASGTTVKQGRTISADPRVLPIGTRVKIEGLQATYTVEDTGGAIKGNHIDLYYDELDDALDWGRQHCEVTVIEWGTNDKGNKPGAN